MRLAWPPPWHLIASVLISVGALALAHLSPQSWQGTLSLAALIFVFLIPGYLVTLSIFPGKSDLSLQRRAFLCLATSALLAGLFSFILKATPRGLQSASLATILSLLAIFLAAVAYGRWSNLPRNRRFLLLPRRGLGSARALPRISRPRITRRRATLAIVLLAAFFIAALVFAFGPYQILSSEPFTELEVAWPGEALSSLLGSQTGSQSVSSPDKEERLWVNLSQNNSGQPGGQPGKQPDSLSPIVNSIGINPAGFNATDNNSTKNTPVIFEEESKVTVLSAGGGSTGGGTSGGMGSSSSASSSKTAAEKPGSQKASQPEETASSLSDVDSTNAAASTTTSKVQSNISVAEKNASNLSIPSNNSNDNLSSNQSGTLEVKPAASPAPLKSPIVVENETQAAFPKSGGAEMLPLSSDNLSSLSAGQSEINVNSNQPPALKALLPDRASPQLQGAAVFWKAQASDEEGDKILYKYLLDGQEVRKWSKTNSWSWLSQGLPAGDYQITVLVRDGKHASEESFDGIMNATFTLSRPNQAPVLQELKPDRSSPQGRGGMITWTASARDPDNDKIYYKFMKNDVDVTDWSSSNSWIWDTSSEKPGDYKIAVLAKDGLHASKDAFDSSLDSSFALTSSNNIPQVTQLNADRSSPQAIGSVITWTAIAVDPDGDEISYKFLANDKEVRGWSSSNSWVWDTSSATPGYSKITVQARDGKHALEDSFDSSKDAAITITTIDSNQPPALKALVPDIASPQVQGTAVVWKAEAQDPEGDSILYKFQLNGRDMSRWTELSSWKWSSKDLPAGDYKIRVLARDGKHASEDSFDSSMDAVFTLISVIDQQIDQLMKKRSSDPGRQENYQSSDIRVTSANGTKSNTVLGKNSSTAG